MKKEIVKKKLTFKKVLVANLNHDAANEVLGGGGTTFSDTPCVCSHTCTTCPVNLSTQWPPANCFCNM